MSMSDLARLLIDSIQNFDVQKTSQLLSDAASPNLKISGKSALYWACITENIEAVKLLIQHGAAIDLINFDDSDENIGTALLMACYIGNKPIVEFLLSSGANPNSKDQVGQTPIMASAKGGHLEIVRDLVVAGARVDSKDINGMTALHWACTGGDFEDICTYLVSKGLNVYEQNNNGETAKDYCKLLKRSRTLLCLWNE
ncbi:ankyrin repeat domain-containing protein [Methylomonas albis]|nr:ankyrin repeat domain-containing protein [Methylomonas albis]